MSWSDSKGETGKRDGRQPGSETGSIQKKRAAVRELCGKAKGRVKPERRREAQRHLQRRIFKNRFEAEGSRLQVIGEEEQPLKVGEGGAASKRKVCWNLMFLCGGQAPIPLCPRPSVKHLYIHDQKHFSAHILRLNIF